MQATQIVRNVMRGTGRCQIYTNKVYNPTQRAVKCYKSADEDDKKMIRAIRKALGEAGVSNFEVRQTEAGGDSCYSYPGAIIVGAIIVQVPYRVSMRRAKRLK